MLTVLHVMLNAGNSMDENCIDATTASNEVIPVLRKKLRCCGTWEGEVKGIDPLVWWGLSSSFYSLCVGRFVQLFRSWNFEMYEGYL